MPTIRKLVFRNEYIYHVFNRGIERRNVFTNIREFNRALELIKFYRHRNTPIRYSQFLQQPLEARERLLRQMQQGEQLIDILAYCLMPNHFHFMLKQRLDKGVPIFVSNFTNAYTKYFNTKHQRVGPLFEGVFRAVLVESDEQLIHLSRYIHLNPVASSIIDEVMLNDYKWSSYPEYLLPSNIKSDIVSRDLVLSMFKSAQAYQKFVLDQVDYAKKLEAIKHLSFD